MKPDDYIFLWNQAAMKVMDIRHRRMRQGEQLRGYRLPASGFLYVTRGRPQVRLNGTEYETDRFHVLHGGKGTCVDLPPMPEETECYWIFYKAEIPLPHCRETQRLLKRGDPFRVSYSFAPLHPVLLYEKVLQMEAEWNLPDRLKRIRVNGLFYQFVYEVLQQIRSEGIPTHQADPAEQAMRFIHEHYAGGVTLEGLAERFDCSPRQLSRLFKRRTGSSPIDYLIGLRMDKAKRILLHTEATLQEIALDIGYPDGYYFSRMFKRFTGLSPSEFKSQAKRSRSGLNVTSSLSESVIVSGRGCRYIDYENHYRHTGEGELTMYRNAKPSLAAVMLLCFTLLLGACNAGEIHRTTEAGGASAQTGGIASQQPSGSQPAAESAETTRSYQNPDGKEVVIPVHPSRVVSNYFFGEMIALGVKPVGIGDSYYATQYPLVKDYTAGIVDLGAPTNFEKVVEAAPDLIVLNSDNNYDQWSRIAPAIVVKEDQPRENIRTFGDILGKRQEAEAWVAEFDAKAEAARRKISGVIGQDETVSIIRVRPNVLRVYSKWLGADILYDEFRLKPTELIREMRENEEGFLDVSLEVLDQYAGDYIFLAIDPGAEDAARSLTESPIWTRIPAVANNRVYPLDQETFLLQDPVSVTQQVDLLTDMITSFKK